jgi:hypothetical protein
LDSKLNRQLDGFWKFTLSNTSIDGVTGSDYFKKISSFLSGENF